MPSPRRLALASLCLAGCLGAARGLAEPAAGQPALPAGEVFSESIDVDVVNVDVFVADRAGHPVRGVGGDDFELRVDGKPVAITNFYASAGAPEEPSPAPAPAMAAHLPAAPAEGGRPLTLALFIDDMNLSQNGRNPTLQLLSRTFRESLGRRDRVLIADWSDRGLKLYAPAAGDGAAVAATLAEIAARPAHGTVNTDDWTKAMQDLFNAQPRGAANPEADEVMTRLDALWQRRQGEAHHMLFTLGSLVDSLGGFAGRKALLYVSGGLAVDSGDPALRELGRHANAAGVTVYGLGAQDEFASILLGTTKLAQAQISPSLLAQLGAADLSQTLQEIAGPTGGVAAVDLNRPGFLVDRIREDASSYYSLGFAPLPEPAEAAPRSHRLEVRVKGRGGLLVRFPATYAARSLDERLAGRARAALLLDPAARESAAVNPLGVRLGFERDEVAAYGRREVTVLVTLPLARLELAPAPAAGPAVRAGRVEMILAARDSTGHELRMRRIEFPVRVPEAELKAAAGKSVAHRVKLELPPGASVLALAVRDAVGGGESTVAARYVAGAAARPAGPATPPERHLR